MRLVYLSISYVPSRSASSVHAMKMCAALARAGCAVELITKLTPSRLEPGVEDDFAFYGVEESFTVTKLRRPARRGGGLVFLDAMRRHLNRRRDVDLVYSRDLGGAWLASRSGQRVIFEAHGLPAGPFAAALSRRLLRRPELAKIVFISRALEELWRAQGLVPPAGRSLVAHDAADPFPVASRAADASPRPPTAGYVGHLYDGRGVELLIEVAKRLPNVDFALVGGRERELARWRSRVTPENVVFHGFVPPGRLPALYASFDILLMPYQRSVAVRSGLSDTARWMSPMKMFEYLATGKAIVSSDLPVLREVLEHGANALLVDPEDAAAWAEAIDRLFGDDALRTGLGERGRQCFVARHTWDTRARAVLAGIES